MPATALARAEPGFFGRRWGRVKRHILAARRARRAARPAIDPGRAHGINKRAVGASVAAGQRRPALLIIQHRLSPLPDMVAIWPRSETRSTRRLLFHCLAGGAEKRRRR